MSTNKSNFEISENDLEASESLLSPSQKLFVSEKTMKLSMNAVRFAIFADAVTGTIEQPNYPIMVLPGAHPDSFPDTGGLGFSAATYFVPMTVLLGIAIASVVMGSASDKVGRKPCIVFCLVGSVIGCTVKYLLRKSFWPYCIANFCNGLVSATVPIAIAYVGDVFTNKKEKEKEIGLIVGISMIGNAGGGILAILMETQGLFAPLLVGAAIMLVAAIIGLKFIIEPSKSLIAPKVATNAENELEEEEEAAPEELDVMTMSVIVLGALLDNIGSSGLMPLCLSPLAFNKYYADFINKGQTPIMPQVAYKWISVLLALMVIPGTMISPFVYNLIGTAGGCILGNVVTGIVTICLLQIALAPPSNVMFGLFVALLYLCFPFTVLSQLTTGPMLDTIAPADKRGFVQGINITVMNFAMAVTPMVLGALADVAGSPVAIWTCVGVSFFAAVVNVPLMFKKALGIPPKKIPPAGRPLLGEEKELVEKVLRGEWIPAEQLSALNDVREEKGQPFLVIHAGKYEDDKSNLKELRKEALNDYKYKRALYSKYLHMLGTKSESSEDLSNGLTKINHSMESIDPDLAAEVQNEIGKWFVNYLDDAGYYPHTDTPMMKQMIMSAFPVISQEKTYTNENVEQVLLNSFRIIENYIALEESKKSTTLDILSLGRGAIFRPGGV